MAEVITVIGDNFVRADFIIGRNDFLEASIICQKSDSPGAHPAYIVLFRKHCWLL